MDFLSIKNFQEQVVFRTGVYRMMQNLRKMGSDSKWALAREAL
ncbi:hypothetical protein B4098_0760 [Heyndrickxia coagulans]|uniref:Uncharacterized protein n=1 Tax=Heyndrickxia coagulans TaxID=1398 RepID=A0A150JTQ9_HEYCO|nr:hypothetical protein B4098_0760 [Heyndrickxia coagulans]